MGGCACRGMSPTEPPAAWARDCYWPFDIRECVVAHLDARDTLDGLVSNMLALGMPKESMVVKQKLEEHRLSMYSELMLGYDPTHSVLRYARVRTSCWVLLGEVPVRLDQGDVILDDDTTMWAATIGALRTVVVVPHGGAVLALRDTVVQHSCRVAG